MPGNREKKKKLSKDDRFLRLVSSLLRSEGRENGGKRAEEKIGTSGSQLSRRKLMDEASILGS